MAINKSHILHLIYLHKLIYSGDIFFFLLLFKMLPGDRNDNKLNMGISGEWENINNVAQPTISSYCIVFIPRTHTASGQKLHFLMSLNEVIRH